MENEIDPVVCYLRVLDTKGNVTEAPVNYFEFIKGQNISLNLKKMAFGVYIVQFVSKSDNKVIARVKIIKI